MANDPNRYAALDDSKDWNMGPFYVVVSADSGHVAGEREGGVMLYRKVGPQFFANAKANNQVVRVATIQLVGPEVKG